MPRKGRGRGRGRGRGQQQGGPGDHGEEEGACGGPPRQQHQQQPRQQHQQQPRQQHQQQQQQQYQQHQQQQQQQYQQHQKQPRQQYQQHQQQPRQQYQQHQQQPRQQYQQQQRQQQYEYHEQLPSPRESEETQPSPRESEEAPSPREPLQEPPQEPEVGPPPQMEEPAELRGAVAAGPPEDVAQEFRKKLKIVEKRIGYPPDRPDNGGTLGRRVRLIVNHMQIILRSQGQQDPFIFMNDVDVTVVKSSSGQPAAAAAPKPKQGGGRQKGDLSKEKRLTVMKQYLFRHPEFTGRWPAYDGNKNIYTSKPLSKPSGQSFTFNIDFDGRGSEAEVRVTVKETQQIDLGILRGYVAKEYRGRQGSSLDMPQDQLRGMTAIFRAALEAADFMSIGRAIIDKQPCGAMRCGPYDIHDGMFMSVRPQMWDIRLNVDKTQVVLRQKMLLADYVIRERQNMSRGRGDPHGPFNPHEYKAIEKKLRGMRVVGDHFMSGGKKYSRKFTVQGLSKEPADRYIIRDLNQTVAQYHFENYRISLQYPHWPCVCTNRDKKTMTPLELFSLLPFQRAPNDDPEITREIIRHAAIKPHDRLGRIQRMVNRLKMDKTIYTFLSKYLIDIDPSLLQTDGRILPPPVIQYDGQKVPINQNQTGAWRADRARYVSPATIEDIYVANFSRNDATRGISDLLRNGQNVGMQLPRFDPGMVQNGLRWSEDQMRRIFMECEQYWKGKIDRCMLIVILPPFDDAYGTVKKLGDNEFGVPTQCIKDRTLGKMNPQTAGNILLKMNAKMNGINWKVQGVTDPVSFKAIMEPFIVFGADVTHPSPTGNRQLTRSIAAVVASMDKACTLYKSEVSFQESTLGEGSVSVVELIQDLKSMVISLLKKFYVATRVKPRRIIFYRDGVSEGQFEVVINREVAGIQEACTELEPGYMPGITFIVVQKRHHTRLFPADQPTTRSGNVPAGTVVDKNIVHPREFDFFLCSHDGIQGTSKPCHYHVLWDDNKWNSDDLQLFTYYLCHCYARCTRSVSYPAPTYYAHLVAFRAREVHGELVDSSDSGSTVSGATSRSGDRRAAEAGDPKRKTPKLDKQYWV